MQTIQKPLSHPAVILLAVLVLTTGCSSERGAAPEPVSLPPTRTPAPPTEERPTLPLATPLENSPTPSPTRPAEPTPSTDTTQMSPAAETTPTNSAFPTPTDTPVSTIPIGRLGPHLLQQEVTIEGNAIAAESFSAGFKFTLDDGSGQVTLLMWHNVYDNCWDRAGINLGARVRATGRVDEYEGQLQVVPAWGGAVRATTPAAPRAEPVTLGALGDADLGRRVMIEGRVVRVDGTSSAVRVFVGDESGEILVFIWRSVLERIRDNAGLGTPGSRVRIVGTVSEYRGTRQLVPTLPVDVIVLEIAQE